MAVEENSVVIPAEYDGIRVEVFDGAEQLLFEARLKIIHDNLILLERTSELFRSELVEDIPVKVRGFHMKLNLGVHMQGILTRLARTQDKDWVLRDVHTLGTDHGRTFSRLPLSAQAWIAPAESPDGPWTECTAVNASAGGVRIRTTEELKRGERLMVRFKLRPGREQPSLSCIVRRGMERDDEYEYGCEFVDLSPETEDIIAKTVIELQLMA